jgi:hypothetical protein
MGSNKRTRTEMGFCINYTLTTLTTKHKIPKFNYKLILIVGSSTYRA